MRNAEEFYKGLHKADDAYSAGTYYFKSLYRSSVLRCWLQERQGSKLRILDVGCGKGLFALNFVRELRAHWNFSDIAVTGTDLIRSPGDFFEEVDPGFRFVQHDADGKALPFGDRGFDFLSCNHVLEHIFETEQLLREFRRVLHPGGLCLISVPNLSAWINRAASLFAGQPLGSELGTEKVTYGFWPSFLQRKLEPFRPSGHIRDFTPRGLRDLTAHCGFKTVGWWPQSHGVVARLGTWAGRNIGILLQPHGSDSGKDN